MVKLYTILTYGPYTWRINESTLQTSFLDPIANVPSDITIEYNNTTPEIDQ